MVESGIIRPGEEAQDYTGIELIDGAFQEELVSAIAERLRQDDFGALPAIVAVGESKMQAGLGVEPYIVRTIGIVVRARAPLAIAGGFDVPIIPGEPESPGGRNP